MAESAHPAIPSGTADQPPPALAGAERGETRGVPASILIGTIALLVVLVSLPHFRAHALEANRKDARVALDVLGTIVFDPTWQSAAEDGAHPLALLGVIETTPRLEHRFPDARRAPDNGQLLHHGYRFDTGQLRTGVERRPVLLAWPNVYGKSGDVAYALASDGRFWGHANGGLWTAGERGLALVDLSDEGWVNLRPARGN